MKYSTLTVLSFSSLIISTGIIALAPPIAFPVWACTLIIGGGVVTSYLATLNETRYLSHSGPQLMGNMMLSWGFGLIMAGVLSLIPSLGLAAPINFILIGAGLLLALAGLITKYSSELAGEHTFFKEQEKKPLESPHRNLNNRR